MINVVIPAYQAERYIARCLDGALAAEFAPGDIILVDDGSRDRTRDIARQKGVRLVELDGNTGAAAARNAGAAVATHQVVFFVDADVIMAPDARAVVVAFLAAHPDVAAVFGAYDADPAAPGRVSRFRNLLHRFVHVDGAGDVATFWTGLGAIRRQAFEDLGGFDQDQRMMEDVKLGMKLSASGARIVLDPTLQGKHLKRWTLTGMAKTDLFDRAIPWSRLLQEAGDSLPDTLNVGWTGRVSVLAVLASLLCLGALAFWPAVGLIGLLASFATIAVANRRFLASLWTGEGAGLAIAGLPLLWLHYLCGGLGYFWVRVAN